jgi:hypothetical protein
MISQVTFAVATPVPFEMPGPGGTVIKLDTLKERCGGGKCFQTITNAAGTIGMDAACTDLVAQGLCPPLYFASLNCHIKVPSTFQFGRFDNKLQYAKNGVPVKPSLNGYCQVNY